MNRVWTVPNICRHLAVMSFLTAVCISPLVISYKPEILYEFLLALIAETFFILCVPLWIKVNFVRKHFYWPDAMSKLQVHYLTEGKIQLAHKEAKVNGYTSRLASYLYKTSATAIIMMLFVILIPVNPILGFAIALLAYTLVVQYIMVTLITVPTTLTSLFP